MLNAKGDFEAVPRNLATVIAVNCLGGASDHYDPELISNQSMQGDVSRRPQLLQFGQAKRGVYV